MSFEDATTATQAIPNVSEESFANIVSRIQAINAGTAIDSTALKQTFVSTGGAAFTSISEAMLIRTTEEVLYSG